MSCPAGTIGPSYEFKCYHGSPTSTYDYAGALAYCTSLSMSAGFLGSEAENAYYTSSVAIDRAYLGITDAAVEGTWVLSATGEPATYFGWAATEPNGDSTVNCAEIYSDGTWNDIGCDSLKKALCITCPTGYELNEFSESCLAVGGVSPAILNGPSGSLGATFNGEVLLYHQFIDTSTGTEGFYRYMNLGFVEADEDIHRVGLTSGGNSFSNLFASTYTSTSEGKVYYFEGEYSSWSAQQILTPPADTVNGPKNHFGSSLALNKKKDLNAQSVVERDYSFDNPSSRLSMQSPPGGDPSASTIFVGCGNCSTIGLGKGAIYLYTQDPKSKTWSQSQVITAPKFSSLGENQVVAYGDLLMADTSTSPILFRKSPRGEYIPEQLLGVNTAVTMFDIYDDTIVYSVAGANVKSTSAAGAVHILAPSKPPPPGPKNKPEPVQWSLQQVLLAPTLTANSFFGSTLSLGNDRMAVNDLTSVGGEFYAYYFERGPTTGKWSLQQKLLDSTGAAGSAVLLNDLAMEMVHPDGSVTSLSLYTNLECLVLSLEDQFGDGWDDARLEVTSPDGTKDYFHSRCDLPNPHRVRFCPNHVKEKGLYRFRVVDIEKSNGPPKNVWEIQWRVYNEDTATWVVGDWESKMDFEWNPEDRKFISHKKEKTHAPNMTCTYCRPRPTDKPTPVLRNRHLKGEGGSKWSTAGPTSTPAPTLEVTNIGNWRSMILKGTGWFRTDYLGASYFVSDAKSHRLVTSGTLCPGEAAEKECWVDLPDGDYNIRVGGALLANPTSVLWTYCRIATPQAGQTQVSVRIADGSCSVLSHHRSSSFCLKTEGTATVAIELLVLGVSGGAGQLQSEDSAALVAALSSALKVASSDVHIVSSAVSVGGAHVTAEVDIHRSSDHDILEVEGIDDTVSSLESYLQGEGHRDIWVGLLSSAHHTVFSQSSSVEFLSMEVVGSKDLLLVDPHLSVEEVVSYADTPGANYHDPDGASVSEKSLEFVSLAGYAIAVGGLLVFLAGLVISARLSGPVTIATDEASEVKPSSISSKPRIALHTLYSSAPSTAALKEFVDSEDKVLSLLLSPPQEK